MIIYIYHRSYMYDTIYIIKIYYTYYLSSIQMSGEVQRPQRSGEFPRGGADQVAELCSFIGGVFLVELW